MTIAWPQCQHTNVARQLMGYLGLVPSEHSTGNSIRRGSITKTGNAHARRLLTEAAWSYRVPARISQQLRQRSSDLPDAVREHAWKAQKRLCGYSRDCPHEAFRSTRSAWQWPENLPASSGPLRTRRHPPPPCTEKRFHSGGMW